MVHDEINVYPIPPRLSICLYVYTLRSVVWESRPGPWPGGGCGRVWPRPPQKPAGAGLPAGSRAEGRADHQLSGQREVVASRGGLPSYVHVLTTKTSKTCVLYSTVGAVDFQESIQLRRLHLEFFSKLPLTVRFLGFIYYRLWWENIFFKQRSFERFKSQG